MAAPILCAPGVCLLVLLVNPHAHKIPCFGGGGGFSFLLEGGGEVAIFILWARGFFLALFKGNQYPSSDENSPNFEPHSNGQP